MTWLAPRFDGVCVRGVSQALRRGVLSLTSAVLLLERAPRDVALQLHFVSQARMGEVNSESRGIDRPTDVLTFSETGRAYKCLDSLLFGIDTQADKCGNHHDGAGCGHSPFALSVDDGATAQDRLASVRRRAALDLGTIYVCVDYMWERCCRRPGTNLPLCVYLQAALVHAELHALGYDHDNEDALREMVRHERRIGVQLRRWQRRFPCMLPLMDVIDYAVTYH